ncbi:MAG: SEL1-like repeat protein [Akkermansia sp.]|nr:SEL1-like repeat protein [Akkermansia sp.]
MVYKERGTVIFTTGRSSGIGAAMMNLAICHHRGLGVPQDEAKAEACLKSAVTAPKQ